VYSRQRTLGRLGRSAPPAVQAFTIPASVAGVDAFSSLMAMAPDACIYTYNLMPVEYGLRLRKGYREWVTGCIESPRRGTGEVRTIIPFESNIQDAANDRLFAVTDEGIWDATLFNNTEPNQVAVFTQTNDPAGRGVWCEFTGDAADAPGLRGHYMFYADGLNGIWQYEEATDAWVQPPSGIGDGDWWYYATPADEQSSTRSAFPVDNVAFVMVFKQRIWVILEDDDDAYYLNVAAISGELTRFFFGSKMPHGGNLMGLWTWTLDGGAGLDDYMVAISRGGDVIIYQGGDPELDGGTTPWSITGAWFVGEVPESRRIVQDFGAESFILSTYGLTSLRNLLQGAPVDSSTADSASQKVNRFLRQDVNNGKDFRQWQLITNPSDGFMQIITPSPLNTPFVQYNMNLNTGAWGNWEDVPITCADNASGMYFMGAAAAHKAGCVLLYDGELDGTTIRGVEEFVPNAPTGDSEWTQTSPSTNEYVCANPGGTTVTTEIDIGFTSVVDTKYLISYTVLTTTPEAEHGVAFGLLNTADAPANNGSGIFSEIYKAETTSSIVTLIGGTTLNATITDINVRLAPQLGTAIDFRTLTSFQSLGEHASFKRVGIARTLGILAGTAEFNINAVYDYAIESQVLPPKQVPQAGLNVWNSALWDEFTWDFSVEGKSFPVGTLGMGRSVAIAMRGNANTRINVVGWDLLLTTGGYL